ncbi:MAG: hypothetical protein E7637_03675 [Ruminococcaceae bacterium]|nr:hypothetical protein [Oscillospiraceae bacterium]
MDANIHKDHRHRMREKAKKAELSSLADHELLELLLFYSIPRVDTNPTAHALLQEFRGIKGVLNASPDELCRVNGVGENSALLIRLAVELLRRYELSYLKPTKMYDRMSTIAQYLQPKFLGIGEEHVYLMLFNNSMHLIDCVLLAKGDVNCSQASFRKITELSLNLKASAVLLAHNHPDGLAIPSQEDLQFTDQINSHLNTLGITLVEHFIFAGMNYLPIMRQHCGMFRCSPISKRLECGFYETFYDVEENACRFEPFLSQSCQVEE